MKTIKIVVTDDHALFRQGITGLLNQQEGLKVIAEAAHGQGLMEILEKKVPDVILMDISMPVMNGIVATKLISEKHPGIKIIMLTMHDNEQIACHLLENGASAFLAKNTDIEIVIYAIFEVVKNGYYLTEETSQALLKARKKTNVSLEDKLSDRETEIIKLICRQQSHAEIAEELKLSTRTVETHKKNILKKTQSKNTAGIVLYAINNNLISGLH